MQKRNIQDEQLQRRAFCLTNLVPETHPGLPALSIHILLSFERAGYSLD